MLLVSAAVTVLLSVLLPWPAARPALGARFRVGRVTAIAPAAEPPAGARGAPPHEAVLLRDGRWFRVFADESALSDYLVERVGKLAAAAIERKGACSISIGSGSTVKPLPRLAAFPGVDFRRVRSRLLSERPPHAAARRLVHSQRRPLLGSSHQAQDPPADSSAAALASAGASLLRERADGGRDGVQVRRGRGRFRGRVRNPGRAGAPLSSGRFG